MAETFSGRGRIPSESIGEGHGGLGQGTFLQVYGEAVLLDTCENLPQEELIEKNWLALFLCSSCLYTTQDFIVELRLELSGWVKELKKIGIFMYFRRNRRFYIRYKC